MKIKDVIIQTATMLQLANVADSNIFVEPAVGEEPVTFDDLDGQTQKDINLIVSCINEVLSDIATDYILLKKTEQIEVQNGQYSLSNLSKPFHKLVDLSTSLPYKIELETLFATNGKYEITYTYLPPVYTFDDETLEFDKKLTIHALCYGVCAEYCLILGNYAESELWNSKFENAMQIAKRNVKICELGGRRWI